MDERTFSTTELIFPGEILHQRLHTSYLDLNKYLDFLKADRFSGRVEVVFDEVSFILDYYDGTFVRAFEEVRTHRGLEENRESTPLRSEEEARARILRMLEQGEGWVEAHSYDPAVFSILVSMPRAEPVVIGVHGQDFDLENFLKDVASSDFSGFLRGEDVPVWLVFYEGQAVQAYRERTPITVEEALKILSHATFSIFSVDRALQEVETHHHTEVANEILTEAYQQLNDLLTSALPYGVVEATQGLELTLREVMREMAESHPYLDPLVGVVQVENGRIRVEDPEPHSLEEVVRATWQALEEAARRFMAKYHLDHLREMVDVTLEETRSRLWGVIGPDESVREGKEGG